MQLIVLNLQILGEVIDRVVVVGVVGVVIIVVVVMDGVVMVGVLEIDLLEIIVVVQSFSNISFSVGEVF